MDIFNFAKGAGEKLWGALTGGKSEQEDQSAKLKQHLKDVGLQGTDSVDVLVDNGKVVLGGVIANQELREKILVAAGNVEGIEAVEDRIDVEQQSQASRFYTVKKGDTLSAIAKAEYGNANDYMKIFEANKPMLKDPSKIYPGQVLRIPQ